MQAPNLGTERSIASRQDGTYLKFYVHEHRKHGGKLLFEWLLETAKRMGIHGGTAFRAVAGFGHHGVLHEQRFVDQAPASIYADLPDEGRYLCSVPTL